MTDGEEFEAWFSQKGRFPKDVERSGEGYKEENATRSWAAWQAARATAEQREPSPTREIWMAEVCQDEDGFKHIESVVEDLDDFAAGTRLYVLDGSKKHDLIDDDLIAKLAHEVSTECLAVPGVNFYMAAEMAIELTIETLGALKDAAIESKQAEQSMPEGYVLVPIEPTQEMMDAGLYQSSHDSTSADVHSIWKDMVAAASESKPAGQSTFSGVDSAYQDWHRENYFGRIAAPKYVEIWRAACSWQAERQNSVIQSLRNALALMMDVGFQHLPANERARRYDIADAAIEAQRSGDGS